MSGGGGSSTTVQKADPWSGVQPYLLQAYQDASQLYSGSSPQYYPGQEIAGFNPLQLAGQLSALNFAATGLPGLYGMGLSGVSNLLGSGPPRVAVGGSPGGASGGGGLPNEPYARLHGVGADGSIGGVNLTPWGYTAGGGAIYSPGYAPYQTTSQTMQERLSSMGLPQFNYDTIAQASLGNISEEYFKGLSADQQAALASQGIYDSTGLAQMWHETQGGGGSGLYTTWDGGGGGGTPMGPPADVRQAVFDMLGARNVLNDPGFAGALSLMAMNDPSKFMGAEAFSRLMNLDPQQSLAYAPMQQTLAGADPTQNLGYQAFQNVLGMGDPSQFMGAGAVDTLLAAADPTTNPYFQGTLEAAMRSVTQAFREQIMPSIRTGSALAGQAGSSRQGIAEGLAASRANQAMADMAAQMGSAAYAQGLQAAAAGGQLGAEMQRLAQVGQLGAGQLGSQMTGQQMQALGQAGQLGLGISGQELQALGQAGQLGTALQGQALQALQGGAGLASGMYGQGLDAATRAAALEYQRALGEADVGQRREAAQLQASLGHSQLAQGGQIAALNALPMLAALGLQQSEVLSNLGGRYQGLEQSMIDADRARWEYEQQLPYQMLNQYIGLLAGAPGGTTSMTSPVSRNPLMSGIGGAMMGAQLLPQLGAAGMLGNTALASTMMGGAGINALGGLALGPVGAIGGGLLGLMSGMF